MLADIVIVHALVADGVLVDRAEVPAPADFIAAVRKWVAKGAALYKRTWSDARVRLAADQLVLSAAGIDVGAVDGVEGVMTQHGWEVYQNKMRRGRAQGGLAPGAPAFCRQSDAAKYYGAPGANHTRITPPYKVLYGDQPVKTILINHKCADSAVRAMQAVLAHYGADRIHALGLDRYGGCFNNRVMRGGTKLSMHAYACAIDWDPVRNPLRADHRTAVFAKAEYAAFLDAWEAEGWVSLGRARDFDWMHVQAATL